MTDTQGGYQGRQQGNMCTNEGAVNTNANMREVKTSDTGMHKRRGGAALNADANAREGNQALTP